MNTLRSTTLILFVLIIFGAIIRGFIPADYEITPEETVQQEASQPEFNYLRLYRLINGDESEQYQIVDIRCVNDFERDHIRGAINIPYEKLLKKEGLKQLGDKKVLIYAQKESRAAASALMLKQLGYKNTNYIPGSFSTIKQYVIEEFDPQHSFYSSERMKYNYKNYIRTGKKVQTSTPKVPAKGEEESINVSGGC